MGFNSAFKGLNLILTFTVPMGNATSFGLISLITTFENHLQVLPFCG